MDDRPLTSPLISLVVACGEGHVIGQRGAMPWHLPADLKYFKRITMGKPIVMGSKTYQSIGRPLPGRHNIVISRNPEFGAPGCDVRTSLGAAMSAAGAVPEIMVIGGAKIYALALPLAHRIYLTDIHQSYEGDTFFPHIGDDWHEVSREVHDAQGNDPAYSFVLLERRLDERSKDDPL